MVFGFSLDAESLLGGSHVAFKKRERPRLLKQEQVLKYKNEETLKQGIRALRRLRTQALAEEDLINQQTFLNEAHQLSEQMAEVIITLASNDKPSQIDPTFLETISGMESRYKHQDAGSGHGLPPKFSITNLFRATDDMLVRIEEKAQSIYTPSHILTQQDIEYILHNFLVGTNDLTINARERFFDKDTRLGGILSGGSVYTEIAKKIIKRYADPSLAPRSFVVAVDIENRESVSETSELDNAIGTVILLDDIIDTGDTVLTALWNVGRYFPNATIRSGKGTDSVGGFEKRRVQKHQDYLSLIYQDFADFSEEGKKKEALAIFQQAEKYAQSNGFQLRPGWYGRKKRLETSC